jgi:phosphoribosylglycinamide formyltransferase 1
MNRVVVFASGSGSNAENVAEYFKNDQNVVISHILTNKKDAYVIKRAEKYQIPTLVFDRDDFYSSDKILDFLIENKTDLIVLAGFLWLVPKKMVDAFPRRIINIHPALLPKYGGKGMYGDKVHEAIVENREAESGITIHYVNDKYDDGDIIFQAKCKIDETDKPADVAQKVHLLEYEYFPKVIHTVISKL